MHRGIIFLSLMLLVIGGIAGYFWGSQKPRPENTPTPSNISGWEAYQNEQYGFELRYPQNDSPWKNRALEDTTYGSAVYVSVEDGHNQLFSVAVDALGHGGPCAMDADIIQNIQSVAGIQAQHTACYLNSDNNTEMFLFSHNAHQFEITFGYSNAVQKEIAYQILSTFRFTN
ncbi:MAG: hypothetical protein A3A33_00155 [Candidatus Yanofskybacteria bacterium RIFCSPLOWO2_01_FULL_49_25]|uniref:DUF4367 domain-containing protein n=1 Tax=Candidatus Yanofskybacteria bacterium RIFCSPLOWO2_01_FULL_49_25 TaxID=1802701 RepID=A0A1F8GUF8_9BACT|nr:MAG: hypothetical protein A3A33_00155 [Candidatus Yanofskybacteria bacterium RIFCSPLOWO2_01_FULL_49_25]